jgi:signal transduction histidine kinase
VTKSAANYTRKRLASGAKSPGRRKEAYLSDPQSLLESLPCAIAEIDNAGLVRSWSNGAQSTLSLPAEGVVGTPISAVLKRLARRYQAPGLAGLVPLFQSAMETGKPAKGWQFELAINKKKHTLQADFLPLHRAAAKPERWALCLQDITERRRLEDATQEIEHLAGLGQLAASVAHEIRNPLSAVRCAAQLLIEEHSGNGQVTRYAGVISREALRLERLVSDFLQFARPPRMQFLPVSLEDLLSRCYSLLEGEASIRGVNLEYRVKGAAPVFFGDTDALLQALLNLGKNSLEATARGGKVSLTAGLDNSRDSTAKQIAIIVRDTGKGIPRKHLTKIGVPFFSTKSGGTGLGFCIAKKIVEAHGGNLIITSLLNKGTRVKLLIPFSEKSED